jgi:hypothetical protein
MLIVLFLTTSPRIYGNDMAVDTLPDESCYKNDITYGIAWAKKTGKCLFAYSQESKSPIISLNGDIVTLTQTYQNTIEGKGNKTYPSLGRRQISQFVSHDNRTAATLTIRVVSSSCSVDNESCCGDDYEGYLEVRRNNKKLRIPVTSHEGG